MRYSCMHDAFGVIRSQRQMHSSNAALSHTGTRPGHMSGSSNTDPGASFAAAVELRPLTIDAMSAVRHLQATSAKRLAAGYLSDAEISAFTDYIYGQTYSGRMADVCTAGRLFGAWLDGTMIATGGWVIANDDESIARLVGLFVSPLYAGIGLGRLMVEAVEAQAAQAGFSAYTVRVPVGAAGFFAHLGYQPASYGVWPLTREISLPVAFMRAVRPRTIPATQ